MLGTVTDRIVRQQVGREIRLFLIGKGGPVGELQARALLRGEGARCKRFVRDGGARAERLRALQRYAELLVARPHPLEVRVTPWSPWNGPVACRLTAVACNLPEHGDGGRQQDDDTHSP